MTKILLLPSEVNDELAARIRDISSDFECQPYTEDGPAPDGAKDAVGVLRWIAGKRFSALIENDAPNVTWLHTASAGVDHVLTPAVRSKCESGKLALTDSGPAFGIAIGEFVVAWMLSVAHRLPELHEQKAAKQWRSLQQEELYGQTAGIVGLGPIGQGIAERCKALGMHTIGLRRRPESVPHVDETVTGTAGLEKLLQESDWVVLAAALTGETRSLIGAEQLAMMKPSARLVNIARGGMIDEPALIAALENKTLAAACLDVFATEPLPEDSPLWTLPNVYIAPHNSSGWTAGLRERQKRLFLDNVARFAKGEPLAGAIDISKGY